MIKLIKTKNDKNRYDLLDISIDIHDHADLSEVLDAVKGFLMACGYFISPGDSIIIDDSDNFQVQEIDKLKHQLRAAQIQLEKLQKQVPTLNLDDTTELDCDSCQCCGECKDE